jgi:hypothetical protein
MSSASPTAAKCRLPTCSTHYRRSIRRRLANHGSSLTIDASLRRRCVVRFSSNARQSAPTRSRSRRFNARFVTSDALRRIVEDRATFAEHFPQPGVDAVRVVAFDNLSGDAISLCRRRPMAPTTRTSRHSRSRRRATRRRLSGSAPRRSAGARAATRRATNLAVDAAASACRICMCAFVTSRNTTHRKR